MRAKLFREARQRCTASEKPRLDADYKSKSSNIPIHSHKKPNGKETFEQKTETNTHTFTKKTNRLTERIF